MEEVPHSHNWEKDGVDEGISMESSEDGSHGLKTPRQVVREDVARE